jgi:hypothetical protein
VPPTVLIASAEHLAALKQHDDLAGAQAFADTEALKALDAITRQRPPIVALSSAFATSSRGVALVNRIKADPALSSCEIRVVAADAGNGRSSSRTAASAHGASAHGAAAVAEPKAQAETAALDYEGTRRVPRVRVADGIEVLIDGNPAMLIDLSTAGAMILSPTIVRPNQRVRMSLPDPLRPIRFGAAVAWAAFELLKVGPRYRAGIEFFDADAIAVQRFIDANRRT